MDPIIISLQKIFNRLVVPKINEAYSSVGNDNSVTVSMENRVLSYDYDYSVKTYVVNVMFSGELPPWGAYYNLCDMFLKISKYIITDMDYALLFAFTDGQSKDEFRHYSWGDIPPFEQSYETFRKELIQNNFDKYLVQEKINKRR